MIKYSKENININSKYLYNNDSWKIIAPLQQTVSIYDTVKEYESDLKIFTIEQRFVFAITLYISEVDNGGHHQFYFNSTGIVFDDALQGLKAIGASEYFKILEEANFRMADGLSQEHEVRVDFLDKHKINFDNLDTRFYELDMVTPLETFLHDYILNNEDKFYFKGEIEVSDFDPVKFAEDFFEKTHTNDLSKMLDEQDLFKKLDSPADNKYFIRLMIYSVLDNKQLLLMFHHQPKLEDPKTALIYCSKVNPGQRLSEVIKKEIKQISGYEDYILNKIYDDGTDFDKHGRELIRYGLVIQMSHFETQGKRFSGLRNAYMSWVDARIFD